MTGLVTAVLLLTVLAAWRLGRPTPVPTLRVSISADLTRFNTGMRRATVALEQLQPAFQCAGAAMQQAIEHERIQQQYEQLLATADRDLLGRAHRAVEQLLRAGVSPVQAKTRVVELLRAGALP